MTREEILEFCGAWLSSWTGNNPEKLLDYYTEDAFYSDPANKGGLRGRQQLLKYFTRLLAANPGWKWEAVEVFPTEGGFTLKWKAAIPVGNQVISELGLDIVEIENGRIARNEVYFDRTGLMNAVQKNKSGS